MGGVGISGMDDDKGLRVVDKEGFSSMVNELFCGIENNEDFSNGHPAW